jgi:hypothetical protein
MRRTIVELATDEVEGPYIRPFLSGVPVTAEMRVRYADWLRARNEPRGELLTIVDRLGELPEGAERDAALARLAELESGIADWWIQLVVRRGRIGNCGAAAGLAEPRYVKFAYECPMSWERLVPRADPRVRFCDRCQRDVHRVENVLDAERLALRGECIDVPGALVSEAREKYCQRVTGRPDPLEYWGQRFLPQT